MDLRDQEPLDKQLRWLHPAPRNDGVLILTIVAMFFAGMILGVVVHKSERTTSM